MVKYKSIYFYLGLILFYLIIFFAPNKPIYFSAYFIAILFFYLETRSIRISLLYSLILSFFSDIGLAGSLFILYPEFLDFGSGYIISPLTVNVLLLLPFSFFQKFKSKRLADRIIFLFFILNLIFFAFFPEYNIFLGILIIGELLLAYYFFRIYISKNNFKQITSLFISILFFESIIALIQLVLRRNIGLTAETSSFTYPFGLTTAEDVNVYRVTGTYGHANFLGSFIVTIFPFLLLYNFRFPIFNILKVIPIIALVFTYSRSAWVVFLFTIFIHLSRTKKFRLSKLITRARLPYIIPSLVLIILIFFALFPYIFVRFETFPQAFAEGSSMNIRLKLIQEACNLILEYPLTGVGLNYANLAYIYKPATDLLQLVFPSKFYSIHNTFLEIATETGIIGFVLFIMFLILTLRKYTKEENKIKNTIVSQTKNSAFLGLIALILISSFHPFFHSTQFRLFILLSSILLS